MINTKDAMKILNVCRNTFSKFVTTGRLTPVKTDKYRQHWFAEYDVKRLKAVREFDAL